VRGSNGDWLVTAALHQGITEQRPSPTPFLGKLVVRLDGGTVSAAADVTATLCHHGRATFVGEESAGGYEGNTSGLNALVVLPHSGLRLKIMMYDYWNAVTPTQKGRGTIPDVIVERRVADLLRGVDAQMNRALEVARP
jgi:C-terminal processing protease CtpA/Prc